MHLYEFQLGQGQYPGILCIVIKINPYKPSQKYGLLSPFYRWRSGGPESHLIRVTQPKGDRGGIWIPNKLAPESMFLASLRKGAWWLRAKVLQPACLGSNPNSTTVRWDSICHRATKPVGNNYWACALEPKTTEQWGVAPAPATRGTLCAAMKKQCRQKYINKCFLKQREKGHSAKHRSLSK